MMTSGNDPAYWFALLRTPAHSRQQLTGLLKKFTSPETIFRSSSRELSAYGLGEKTLESIRNPDWHGVETDLAWLSESGNYLVTLADREYPGLLRQIFDPLSWTGCS